MRKSEIKKAIQKRINCLNRERQGLGRGAKTKYNFIINELNIILELL